MQVVREWVACPAEVCPRRPGTGLMQTLSGRSRGHRSMEDCHLSQNEWVPVARGGEPAWGCAVAEGSRVGVPLPR